MFNIRHIMVSVCVCLVQVFSSDLQTHTLVLYEGIQGHFVSDPLLLMYVLLFIYEVNCFIYCELELLGRNRFGTSRKRFLLPRRQNLADELIMNFCLLSTKLYIVG